MAEGKKVALWVGVGCGIALLIAIVGVVLCVGVCAGGVLVVTEAPAQASHAFFADLRGNNVDGAYQKMSPSYRQTHTIEAFRQAVSQQPVLAQQTDSTFMQRNISPPRASLGGFLTAPTGQVPVQVQLSQEGQQWLIDAVTVQGQAL